MADDVDPVSHPPPAGGYGAADGPTSRHFGPAAEAGAAPRRSLRPLIIIGIALATVSTLGVLGVVGIRRYIAVAKTAEARIALTQMATQASVAHQAEHRVCPSASHPVPSDLRMIRGRKYQSMASEWLVDKPSHAGFACLQFEVPQPQYFQYAYEATASSFVGYGRGDLDGDGVRSEFAIRGRVEGERLVVSDLTEKDTEE